MARKNVLTKVKTSNGYDTLYSLTPYQIIWATNVQGNGSNYALTVPLPNSEMIVPILIRFKANVNAAANCTVSVNGSTPMPFLGNVYGNISSGDDCIISFDLSNSKCNLLSITNKSMNQQSQVGSTTLFDGNTITENYDNGGVTITTFNDDGSIVESITQNGLTIIKTTTFNADGSITEVIS